MTSKTTFVVNAHDWGEHLILGSFATLEDARAAVHADIASFSLGESGFIYHINEDDASGNTLHSWTIDRFGKEIS